MHWNRVHVKFDPIVEMMIEYLIYKIWSAVIKKR